MTSLQHGLYRSSRPAEAARALNFLPPNARLGAVAEALAAIFSFKRTSVT